MYILTVQCEYTVENYNGSIEPYKCFQREEEVYDFLYSILKKKKLKKLKFFHVHRFVNPFHSIDYDWDGKKLLNDYNRTLFQDKDIHVESEYEYEQSIKDNESR